MWLSGSQRLLLNGLPRFVLFGSLTNHPWLVLKTNEHNEHNTTTLLIYKLKNIDNEKINISKLLL